MELQLRCYTPGRGPAIGQQFLQRPLGRGADAPERVAQIRGTRPSNPF